MQKTRQQGHFGLAVSDLVIAFKQILYIHHLSGLAGFFRREDHQVAFERFIRAGEDFGRILLRDGGNEGVHQAVVAAAMAAQDAAVVFDGGVNDGLLVGQEIEQRHGVAVSVDGAFGSEDARQAAAVGIEGGHRHGDGAAVVEKHVDDLIVHDVVVAGIDAASIGPVAQSVHDGLPRNFVGGNIDRPAGMPFVQAVAQIDFDGGIGAVLLDFRRAVRATRGSSFWSAIGAEMLQRSE